MILDQVALTEIRPAPWNVRTGHDVEGIADSIRVNEFRSPVEVWHQPGGPHHGEIVAGEGRYHAAKRLGLDAVPVVWHEFDSLASAKRYAIANNRLTDKSQFDPEGLIEQLRELDSLAGTGFTDEDLEALDPLEEPAGPGGGDTRPEGRYQEQFGVIVMCNDEGHQEEVYNALQAEGYECKVVTT